MATRARIGLQQDNGTIIAAYQHWDGYPGGLGYTLCEHWEDPAKVEEGIRLGDASNWKYIVGTKVDFDDRNDPMHDVQNVYYGRDRGEKNVGFRTYKDEAEFIAEGFNTGEEYIYLMKNTGKKDYLGKAIGEWFYCAYDKKFFIELEEVAINEHIEMLKRHLELMKQQKAA